MLETTLQINSINSVQEYCVTFVYIIRKRNREMSTNQSTRLSAYIILQEDNHSLWMIPQRVLPSHMLETEHVHVL